MLLVNNLCEFDRKIAWNGAKNVCVWHYVMMSYAQTWTCFLNIRNIVRLGTNTKNSENENGIPLFENCEIPLLFHWESIK
jgi:hypothetical protein